jgi:hypothetical protein
MINPPTKKQTSLYHFRVLPDTSEHKMKRDQVQQQFTADLEINRITKSFELTVKWLCSKSMLYESRECPNCRQTMRLVNSHAKVKDGLIFRCTRAECIETKVGIRTGTIFDGSHLTLMEFLRITFYHFTRGFNAL